VRYGRIEPGHRRTAALDSADKSVQPPEAVQLISIAHLRSIERTPEHRNGFVVRAHGHWKRATVFAAKGERESRRIGESSRSAVYDFGDQSQRLKRSRT
jgi:hypothetical protein